MKYLVPIALVVLVGIAAGFWFLAPNMAPKAEEDSASSLEDARVVEDGEYVVDPSKSRIEWAGKKPLIDGYINTGSLAVSEGAITRSGEEVAGRFVMDMRTLSVTATPKKPGKEGALEEHLAGERWFDVANHPTATFAITSVVPRADSDTTHIYDVTGDLTLKGTTHPASFPATIYEDQEGSVHASASFEIDRTKWGITAGSSSFFDNLADNAVDDMVALSFSLVAVPR